MNFFKTVKHFSDSKPRHPGEREIGQNSTPWEICKSEGGDQAWNWLIHYPTKSCDGVKQPRNDQMQIDCL